MYYICSRKFKRDPNPYFLLSKPIMKKFSVFIGALLIIIMSACGQKKTYRIGISQCSSDDWRSKMNEEVMREAMLHDDIEVEILSAEGDSENQISDIEYFVDKGFDLILIAPNEADVLTPEVKKVHEKGIPVIIFDRNINDSSFTQRIGVNNIDLGQSVAEYAISLLSGDVKAIEVYGLPGSTPAIERSKGFNEIISESGNEVLATAAGNWEEDKAELVADSMLREHPDANLIFAHNDRMAIGARKAADRLGRSDIKIIGIDAAPKIGITAVSEGKIDATFLYPTEGDFILREAINIVKGLPFEREIMLPTTSAVDSSNADILLLQNKNLEDDTKKVLALKDQLDNYVSLHNAQTALVYAIIAILILLFGVLFLVLRTFWAHRRHKDALLRQNRLLEEERDKQKELNEKLEQATQSKLAFFTNVSHDLRTPLTLITEPISQLKGASNLSYHQNILIKIADKNVKILHRLIDKILDFRKFEDNKLPLVLSEIDFRQVIREWLESFHALAKKRHIKIVLNEPAGEDPIKIAIDIIKFESVFFNLVSNAFKYSPDNSTITVNYKEEDGRMILKVIDTGLGISEEHLPHIFDRFFQVEHVRPHGSGIGLSLAKAFIELHGGTLSVKSELKKGSEFIISIPVVHVADEISEFSNGITPEIVSSELEEFESEVDFSEDKPVVLIIDDNKDIREMLTELLKSEYNILTAPNGKEGIKRAYKYVPDLIICDVMMPGMDGMECCSKLKADPVTSHIPVLMLTACRLDEQKVQGYDSGADGYIAKPFSTPVLKSHISSLITNRKRVKEVLRASVPHSNETEKAVKLSEKKHNDIDNDFYNKFLILFEKKISDPELNVETIASELGFERTQLYRKIKAITNYSPVELMRHLRLKKAKKILKTTDKTISEICYEVGFSNPAYFTKCYREQFGETPSESRLVI